MFCVNNAEFPIDGGDAAMISLKASKKGIDPAYGIVVVRPYADFKF